MSWVTIDQDKCNGCGICAKACLRCFTDKEGVITVHADEQGCNLCGHCVSLCSTNAITHSKMDMDNFPAVPTQIRYDPDEFVQFVRQRRSCRNYSRKEVPREDLEKLIEMCRYVPTGSNLQTVQIKVITNKEKLKELSDLTIDYFINMIGQVEDQVKRLISEKKEIPKELEIQRGFANRYRILAEARGAGLDPILHQAPVVMIFHSAPSPSTPKDDCVIASQTVVLAAMNMRLGTCYMGLVMKAAQNSPQVYQSLGLPAGNTAHSILAMGYPKLKFLRTVDRKPMTVQWEE
jgi:nitroreductase/NAD-dependent dihydropyrimidine dehydrogenase PreA subunit